jgi:hypothetical protein
MRDRAGHSDTPEHLGPGNIGVMSAGLTAEEWGYLIELLRRLAENDLAQHDAWRFETSHGPVYLRLDRKRRAGETAEAFRPAEPRLRYRTGRAARVSNLSEVSSREDVLRVVGEMTADLEDGGTAESENATLARSSANENIRSSESLLSRLSLSWNVPRRQPGLDGR